MTEEARELWPADSASEIRRRDFIGVAVAITALAACGTTQEDCDSSQINDDGDPDSCVPTAEQIEGPFYLAGAPARLDLDTEGDDGEALALSGVCRMGECDAPLAGARIEFWHADPSGAYDNSNGGNGRYRGHVITDEGGNWALQTLMPGHYKNGTTFRPAHIHVKVFTGDTELLTTQLYFEGDRYLECDPFANTSLVIPLADGAGTFDFLV